MNKIIYAVFYGDNSTPVEDEFGNQGFETFCDALEFAKAHMEEQPLIVEFVAEYADTGEVDFLAQGEKVWDYTFTPDQENELINSSKCNVYAEDDFSELGDNFEDYYMDFPEEEFLEEDHSKRGRAQKYIDQIEDITQLNLFKEALEENEDEVECESCLELVPKCDCKKTDSGYICKACEQEHSSHEGTALDLIDADTSDIQYDDPRFTKKVNEEFEDADFEEADLEIDEDPDIDPDTCPACGENPCVCQHEELKEAEVSTAEDEIEYFEEFPDSEKDTSIGDFLTDPQVEDENVKKFYTDLNTDLNTEVEDKSTTESLKDGRADSHETRIIDELIALLRNTYGLEGKDLYNACIKAGMTDEEVRAFVIDETEFEDINF